jgi:predicted dinucleotide-binding enzyme
MKIAIIGAGNVGGALGAALSRVGHDVVFGVRDPQSEKTRQALAGTSGHAADFKSATGGADVVLFALRWDAVADVVGEVGDLPGVVVIDAMNRFGGEPQRSTADDLAELLPQAKIVKAFNTTGFENMSTAADRREPAAMFVAGDDAQAKQTAMYLAREIGFMPYDVGPLSNAKPLEEMVKVWLAIARTESRRIAFAISEG